MGFHDHYQFQPDDYESELVKIIEALTRTPPADDHQLLAVLRKHPKDGGSTFSKSQIIKGFRHFKSRYGWQAPDFIQNLRMKPVRTASGVAPITVLTKPFPCPGKCIFCPNDVRMPKSYLSMEPGAQRATQNAFDPYAQTTSRLLALYLNGHVIDKVELIILGGTWSSYPEPYQIWFVKRCFDALNTFDPDRTSCPPPDEGQHDFLDLELEPVSRYNTVVRRHLKHKLNGALLHDAESSSWQELETAHRMNETAACRSVGLVLETRPDEITDEEVVRLRRLGATKVQIGVQSLNDDVLKANRRGHDVNRARSAMKKLRRAGFKLHAHWMPNLYTATVETDLEDFDKLFADEAIRPDELKIYPCALIESADLMDTYKAGKWAPYDDEALTEVLVHAMAGVPRWCRTTRVVRDIPSHDIVVGNKLSNFREIATGIATQRGFQLKDIRSREIRCTSIEGTQLRLQHTTYASTDSEERFLEFVDPQDRIAAFLRLSLPREPGGIHEIAHSALIREVHVYGPAMRFEDRVDDAPQHGGLGKRLVETAGTIAEQAGYEDLAVISAIGTRNYYRKLGFDDGALYMHRPIRP